MICPICEVIVPVRLRMKSKPTIQWRYFGACECGRLWGYVYLGPGIDYRQVFEGKFYQVVDTGGYYMVVHLKTLMPLMRVWELYDMS